MVKGISRQVIVLYDKETEMFDQAIFILKENARPVSDDVLLKEAKKLLHSPTTQHRRRVSPSLWICAGAAVTGAAWLITSLL